MVDSINPDKKFPLYLAFYPYGSIDADTTSSLFPDGKGGYFRLTDTNVSSAVFKDLGYSARNTPLAMVLDKEIECFVDRNEVNLSIPWLISGPGEFFPLTRILPQKNTRVMPLMEFCHRPLV